MTNAQPAPPPHPDALRIQILTAEHYSLLASRGLAWNEIFSRASMFLATLSSAMVALGLVAGIDRFGSVFVTFALVVLPIVLFLGLTTTVRMGAANYHDALTVVGMNRIRGGYLELAPELAPFFVMSAHDDMEGVTRTMAVPPGSTGFVHLVAATPFVINVLNSALAGAIAAIVSSALLGWPLLAAIVGAAAAFSALLAAQLRVVATARRRGQGTLRPMFPTHP